MVCVQTKQDACSLSLDLELLIKVLTLAGDNSAFSEIK